MLNPTEVPQGYDDLPEFPCAFRPSTVLTAEPGRIRFHTLYAAARDAAGNDSPVAGARFGLRFAPDATLKAVPPKTTTDKVARFTFTTTEDEGGSQSPQCRVDGGEWYGCQSPTATTLRLGTHTFEVRGRDELGLDPTPSAYGWTIVPAGPEVEKSSCRRPLSWTSFGVGFEPACRPIEPAVCPPVSRCTLDTTASVHDDDPVNRERFEEDPTTSPAGYYAYTRDGIYEGRVLKCCYWLQQSCFSGKPPGPSLDPYTHSCRVSGRFEHVTGANSQVLRNECEAGRFYTAPDSRPYFDRGPDEHRFMQCFTTFTVVKMPSALGDAWQGLTPQGYPVFTVQAPSPGTLSTSATMGSIGGLLGRAAAAPRAAARTVTKAVKRAGAVRVRLKLTTPARKALRRRGRLRVTVTYEFTPVDGQALIRSRTVTLRRR